MQMQPVDARELRAPVDALHLQRDIGAFRGGAGEERLAGLETGAIVEGPDRCAPGVGDFPAAAPPPGVADTRGRGPLPGINRCIETRRIAGAGAFILQGCSS